MTLLLEIVYIVVCVFLIVVVLLQHGKGADIGVSLGAGSSNTVFGARGAGNFLTKLTTVSAVLFMVLAFTLARFAADDTAEDLLGVPATDAPAELEEIPAPDPAAESTAPPSEPGGAPSGFETIETPATTPPATPAPAAPSPAPAPTKPPS